MSLFWKLMGQIWESWTKTPEKPEDTDLPGLPVIRRQIDYIVIHHSLTDDNHTLNWNAIRKYHTEVNGWDDVGYHYGIEYVGETARIVNGRSTALIGAHVKGLNTNSIGICVVGNFDKIDPPQDKWELALALTRTLRRVHNVPVEKVLGHGEAQRLVGDKWRKSCPGLRWNMHQFRAEL